MPNPVRISLFHFIFLLCLICGPLFSQCSRSPDFKKGKGQSRGFARKQVSRYSPVTDPAPASATWQVYSLVHVPRSLVQVYYLNPVTTDTQISRTISRELHGLKKTPVNFVVMKADHPEDNYKKHIRTGGLVLNLNFPMTDPKVTFARLFSFLMDKEIRDPLLDRITGVGLAIGGKTPIITVFTDIPHRHENLIHDLNDSLLNMLLEIPVGAKTAGFKVESTMLVWNGDLSYGNVAQKPGQVNVSPRPTVTVKPPSFSPRRDSESPISVSSSSSSDLEFQGTMSRKNSSTDEEVNGITSSSPNPAAKSSDNGTPITDLTDYETDSAAYSPTLKEEPVRAPTSPSNTFISLNDPVYVPPKNAKASTFGAVGSKPTRTNLFASDEDPIYHPPPRSPSRHAPIGTPVRAAISTNPGL